MSLLVEGLKATVGNFTVTAPRLEVGRGEIVCLMGRSGSGKSTLLAAISGFLTAASGRIVLGDVDVTHLPPERRRMALVFQKASLFSHLTVQGNVEFGLRVQGVDRATRETRAKEWLEKLSIGELAMRRPSEVSEGQAQRIALARALAVGFPGLLLDEPFSALDVSTRRELRQVVKRLVAESGTSALMVTHHPEDAIAVSDFLHVIEDGNIVWTGPPRAALKSGISSVSSLFTTDNSSH